MSDNNVVSFADKKLEKEPHIAGEAICGGCKHTWVAIAPEVVQHLECPACGTHRGLWKYNFAPEWATLECPECEGHVFMVSITGVFCIGCGTSADFKTVFGE